jgi:hypothetical protein
MNRIQRFLRRPYLIRLLHWEYWSFHVIYGPIYIVWIGLCLRARSFFFFSASNPRIRNGGFLSESKKEITELIPPAYCPRTAFFSVPANGGQVVEALRRQGLRFPLIGKPDIGGRGRGVKALGNEEDVIAYTRNCFADFHIQEFVAYTHEVGIFYYRFPQEQTGSLSGIVRKEFLSVKGDGISTVQQLMAKDTRAILQIPGLEQTQPGLLREVLAPGEDRILLPYGNHARGAKFLDDSHLIDEGLTSVIDRLCREIPEFYYGRLDIRFQSWEELKLGRQFTVIEVNGAGSEPTHIYDPRHSLFFAWKEIIRHWILLWRISRENHRLGIPYLGLREGLAMFREDAENSRKLQAMKV